MLNLQARVPRDESGSVPIALLVAIIVAGLVVVVMARTVAETRATGFDRDFHFALHGAEAGVNEALFELNNDILPQEGGTGTGEVDGVAYEWTATPGSDGVWTLRSMGSLGDVEREVEVSLANRSLFDVAAFAEVEIGFAGANGADSYNSQTGEPTHCTWTSDHTTNNGNTPESICSTGRGSIGSNGRIDLSGGNAYADAVFVYDWDSNPDQPGSPRCTSGGSEDFCDDPYRSNIGQALDYSDEQERVEEITAGCPESSSTWQASNYASGGGNHAHAVLQKDHLTEHPDEDEAGAYCANDLIFDRDTVLHGDVTVDEPLRIYVRGSVTIGRQGPSVDVNCVTCGGDGAGSLSAYAPPHASMPQSRRLQIYAAGSGPDDDVVKVHNQTRFGGAIFAPNGSCGRPGRGSNAQSQIYGSLLCLDLRNVGGWKFHYDEDLASVEGGGSYEIIRWNER